MLGVGPTSLSKELLSAMPVSWQETVPLVLWVQSQVHASREGAPCITVHHELTLSMQMSIRLASALGFVSEVCLNVQLIPYGTQHLLRKLKYDATS